ncbi:MAG: thioredoxin family protein [Bacteroidales bacterium]|nr:thioredoxin family protein [Bacteroidales bacterium]
MSLLKNFRGLVLTTALIYLFLGCNSQQKPNTQNEKQGTKEPVYKVTFIELGSVRCIPCQKMQPIMKSIEQKYSTQVKVVFHDVWTEAGAPYSKQYGIEAIPTQVFLDKDGKEYFRHVGFFPEEQLIKVLNQKGVK